ncbi:MAG: hypothetical protein PHH91_08250 [Desulfuromonadaceae bacterium]|nr:hypothetical protein [Desulfuromonadaceae bacterium]
MKNIFLSVIVSALMLSSVGTVYAAEPELNVSSRRHPNIASAQVLSRQAYYKIVRAQRANRNDLGGHAQRAKELLVQVNEELKLSAGAANQNRRRR